MININHIQIGDTVHVEKRIKAEFGFIDPNTLGIHGTTDERYNTVTFSGVVTRICVSLVYTDNPACVRFDKITRVDKSPELPLFQKAA